MGCLFFLDTPDNPRGAGLTALGILLMVLNAGYVALMAYLIVKHGRRHLFARVQTAKRLGKSTLGWLMQHLHCGQTRVDEVSSHSQRNADITPAPPPIWKLERSLMRGLSNLSVHAAYSGSDGH